MDEIKAKLQYKFVKLENDSRFQYFKESKEKQYAEIEKLKLEKEIEVNQKMKIISQEHEILTKKLHNEH